MKRSSLEPTRYEYLSQEDSDLYDYAMEEKTRAPEPVVKNLATRLVDLIEKKAEANRRDHASRTY